MKRFLALPLAIAAITLTVPDDANALVYASRLTKTNQTVGFVLNKAATSGSVNIVDQAGTVVATKPLVAAELTKGTHSGVQLPDISNLASGTYTWSITVGDSAVTVPTLITSDSNPPNQFYRPYGLTIDNYFDSPNFGNIYVAQGLGAAAGTTRRLTTKGVYMMNAACQDYANQGTTGYQGNVDWIADADSSPNRISVIPNGNVLITDFKDAHSGLWMFDTINPSNNFSSVFSTSLTRSATGILSNGSIQVAGNIGHALYDGKKLFTLDEDLVPPSGVKSSLASYDWDGITPIDFAPTFIYNNNPQRFYTADGSLAFDPNEGIWVGLYRGTDANTNPSLVHFKKNINDTYTMDYNSSGTIGVNYRGAMALTKDGKRVAVTNNGVINIFDIDISGSQPKTSANPVYQITASTGSSSYIRSLAFDAAGNLYFASCVTERLRGYALPQTATSYSTPAPSSQASIAVTNAEVTIDTGDTGATITDVNGNPLPSYFPKGTTVPIKIWMAPEFNVVRLLANGNSVVLDRRKQNSAALINVAAEPAAMESITYNFVCDQDNNTLELTALEVPVTMSELSIE